jgi:Concanavalin A-like lectin/glucanases superfamily
LKNKNSSVRKAAFACLSFAVAACEPFDPATSADLKAQWSADSLALRDGDAVSRWSGSASNRHSAMAMATASSRPTYRIVDGVPVVHFDGIDDFMTAGTASDWTFLSDGSDWTVLVVFRSEAGEPGGKYVLLDSGGADTFNSGFTVSYDGRSAPRRRDAVQLSVAAGNPVLALDMKTGNRNFAPGKWGIISATFEGFEAPDNVDWGKATLFVNGYPRAVAEAPLPAYQAPAQTALNIGRYALGSAFPTKGDIREIVIYGRALAQDEHYQAIRYLAGKVSPAVRIRPPLSRKWFNTSIEGYQAFGMAFRVPSTGKLVAIQRQGMSHVGGPIGEVRQWESNDRGATWTTRLTYDSQYDDRNVGGGLASTGSILAFIARYDGVHWIDMRALRSVDDAQTFSDIGAPLPTNGCREFSPYGPMIELPSGRLLQTFYGSGRTFKAWISESVDDGLTWTYKTDIYNGPLQVNETSLAWISGADDATSTLVAVSRNDGGAGLLQFVSRDGGSTWTSQGLIPGGAGTDVSPWLHRLSDGTLVNAWHERSWFTFRIRTAPADEVAASPSHWGPTQVTYHAVTRVVGDSGYPALLSATGWDDDLIQVMYDSTLSGSASLVVSPISLP